MSAHLIDGQFQSDKYPTCPRGKVPLSVNDPAAQDLLWEYAQRRRIVDAEFSDDLETALRNAGYVPRSFTSADDGISVIGYTKERRGNYAVVHLEIFATTVRLQQGSYQETVTTLTAELANVLLENECPINASSK